MSAKGRLIFVLTAAIAFDLLLTWLSLSHHYPTGHIAFIGILVLGIAPIYPLFQILKKRTGSSALAILMLIAALLCGLAYFTGSLILRIDTGWVSIASRLSEILILASCVLFIWNGFIRRNRQ